MHRRALLKQVLHPKAGANLEEARKEDEEFMQRKRLKKEEQRRADEAKKSLLEKHNELVEADNGSFLYAFVYILCLRPIVKPNLLLFRPHFMMTNENIVHK